MAIPDTGPVNKILIVEDEVVIAADLRNILENLGYEVCGAADSGPEVLTMVERLSPDIVLMDIMLKGPMDGIETAESIRARHDLPVVFITAWADDARLRRAKLTLPFGYIIKPFSEKDLKVTIDMALYAAKADAERRKMEENLRLGEAKYRTLVEDAPIGFAVIQESGYVYVNAALADLLGYTQEELLGFALDDIFNLTRPEDRPLTVERIHAFLRSEIPPSAREARLSGKDGRLIWVKIWSKRIEFNGRPAVQVFYLDITDRHESETALQQSRAELESIFRAAPTGIGFVSNRTILMVNDRLCEMTGYASGELIGQNSRILYPSDEDYEFVGREKYRQILEKGTGTVETHWRRKDGVDIDVLLSSTPFDRANLRERVAFTALDITARKMVEKNLRENEHRLHEIIANAPFGAHLWELDTDGVLRFVGANRAADKILNLDHEALMYKPIEESFPGNDGTPLPDIYRRLCREGGRYSDEQVSYRDGRIDSAFEIHAFGTTPGRMAVFFRDVMERRRAEEERVKLENQLRQSQKMEAIGTLAGGIAHDFNNILAAIIGYTELAMMDIQPGARVRNNLEQVLRAGQRAKDLVKQILDFSRLDGSELKPIELAPIVKETLKLLRSTLPSTIEIRQTGPSDPLCIKGNPTQIHQVLMNLVANAAHAMRRNGGVLEIDLEEVELDRRAADLLLPRIPPGRYCRITVRDTGQGMDRDVIGRIFEPFFTTKAPGEGTGVGLAVAFGIVKNHRGGLTVSSEVDRGSEFRIYLPLIKAGFVDATIAGSPSPVPTGREHVLLVDDEPALTDLGRETLEHLGYRVTGTNSSLDALNRFRNAPDRFDLVITDQTMPHLTGLDLARELVRIRPEIPVILCTGFSREVAPEAVLGREIKAVLMKPLSIRDVGEAVRAALDGSRERKTGTDGK